MSDAEPDLIAVRVWDLPTRAFHWVLALPSLASVVSAKIGGNAMVWHLRFGYVVFALLAFRLLWGLVGGRWSRFSSFVYAPGTVLRYLRGQLAADEHHRRRPQPAGQLVGVCAARRFWPCRWPPAWWPTTRSPTSAR